MTRYRCVPSLVWVQDAGRVLLVDQETLQAWTLEGAEAAAWDLLALGYPAERVVAMLALLLDVPAGQAASFLEGRLAAWLEVGMLQEGK